MKLLYILVGAFIISVIIFALWKGNESGSDNGNCTSQTCSDWIKNPNVNSAYKPCIENVLQPCDPYTNNGCNGLDTCVGGCCISCEGTSRPDSATKSCTNKPVECTNYTNTKLTNYICRCSDEKCSNYTATYIDTEGNEQKVEENQERINEICSLPKPANWINVPISGGINTSLWRGCNPSGLWTDAQKFTNFVCPNGSQKDMQDYKCTEGILNVCCLDTDVSENNCANPSPTNLCNPANDPESSTYCPDGTLNCIQKTADNNYKGHYNCEPDSSLNKENLNSDCANPGKLSQTCYPCCDSDKGFYFDRDKKQCVRIPYGYTVGYEQKDSFSKQQGQVLVRIPPAFTPDKAFQYAGTHDDGQGNIGITPQDFQILNSNISPNNNVRNIGYVPIMDTNNTQLYTDSLVVPNGAYYAQLSTQTWTKCNNPNGCSDNIKQPISSTLSLPSLQDPNLTQNVTINPNDIPVASNVLYPDSANCSVYPNNYCPGWCEIDENNNCNWPKKSNDECKNIKPITTGLKFYDPDNDEWENLGDFSYCSHPLCGLGDLNTCISCNVKSGEQCPIGCTITPSNECKSCNSMINYGTPYLYRAQLAPSGQTYLCSDFGQDYNAVYPVGKDNKYGGWMLNVSSYGFQVANPN